MLETLQWIACLGCMSQVGYPRKKLEIYIHDMQSIEDFSVFRRIEQLVKKMVKMKKNVSYPLVYSLVTLALILLVTTATVERVFSVINIIKN